MKTRIRCIACSFLMLSSVFGYSQKATTLRAAIEAQAYPTGLIPGIRVDIPLADRSHLHLRAGYQFIDHRSLGVQDDEEGTGYGGSVGFRYYPSSKREGLSFSFRTDFWWNTIDWKSFEPIASGSTDLLVIQPTIMMEYDVDLGDEFFLSPQIAFGYEWNARTEGEPTGQGAILLLGVSVGRKF